MNDVAVVETAQHVDNGVTLTDVGQKLVAQSLSLAGSLHQSGNIYYVANGRDDASRVDEFSQAGESLIGHADLSQLGVDGTEGEIGCLCLGTGQAVEKG